MPTNPGINSSFEFGFFSPEERHIIRKFSNHFYVTRSVNEIQIGNSRYKGFLIRPAEDLSIILNVEREIAVVLSTYDSFEARSLEAFEKIYRALPDTRIDRTVRFFISKDVRIEDSIQHYLHQNLEHPIIIPIPFSAFFSSGSDDAAISSIRRNYLIRDLFGLQSPLQQEYYYFGRDQIVNSILDMHRIKQNSSLFGLRKSGKTSTIFAIQRRAKSQNIRTLVIDCEDPEIHAKPYDELLFHIINKIREDGNMKPLEFPSGLRADVISNEFKTKLSSALSQIRSNILIIFDEIENISPRTAASEHWRTSPDQLYFWQILRSFFQFHSKYYISFCFVGTNPQLLETPSINDVSNPVYLFAPKNYLPGLDFETTRSMIIRLGYFMGLNFSPEATQKLYQKFGGHPFFTRQVCSSIHKKIPLSRPRTVLDSDVQSATEVAAGSLYMYISEILDKLKAFYPDEFEMLEHLSNRRVDEFNFFAKEAPEYLEHILGYGILRKHEDRYIFAIHEFSEYLREKSKPIFSREEALKEVMVRRDRLEREIRKQLYFYFSPRESDELDEALKQAVSQERYESLQRSPRDLFSEKNSPLYWIEEAKIMRIIKLYGDRTDLVFKSMMIVNDCRYDAHAKGISEEELKSVRVALDDCEDYILSPD